MSAEAIRLCCLLWAAEGEVDGLHAYEDAALALLPRHGGAVVNREFGGGAAGTPHEVQIFAFRERAGLESYLGDPARTGRAAERDRVVARTELFPVRLPESDGPRP